MPRSPDELKRLVEAKRTIIRVVKDQPCADCGKRFPTAAMDFDHRDPVTKRCDVAKIANGGYGITSLLTEILLCDVVCATCHRIRTHGD